MSDGSLTVEETLARLTAKTWALACVTRDEVTRPWIREWPESAMTWAERRRLEKMRSHLAAAVDESCRLQASLARRTREAGLDAPDFDGVRDAK